MTDVDRVSASLHLIFPLDLEQSEAESANQWAFKHLELLVGGEGPFGSGGTDPRMRRPEQPYPETVGPLLEFRGRTLRPVFYLRFWNPAGRPRPDELTAALGGKAGERASEVTRLPNILPISVECVIRSEGFTLGELMDLWVGLQFKWLGGESRRQEADFATAISDQVRKIHRLLQGTMTPQGPQAGSTRGISEGVAHEWYGVCVIEAWNEEDEDALRFSQAHKRELMALLLKPWYNPSDLDIRQADVLDPANRFSYSRKLLLDFGIRCGLIVVAGRNELAVNPIDERHEPSYSPAFMPLVYRFPTPDKGGTRPRKNSRSQYQTMVNGYLDGFAILRCLWAKAAEVTTALDTDFFSIDEEDPLLVFSRVKDLQAYLNSARLEYQIAKGSHIYREQFAVGLDVFGINDATAHVSKAEALVSARSSYELANSTRGLVARTVDLQLIAGVLACLLVFVTLFQVARSYVVAGVPSAIVLVLGVVWAYRSREGFRPRVPHT